MSIFFAVNSYSPSLLPSLPSLPPCFPQSTVVTLSREWLTPWSLCAALSSGLLAGTLSLNVSSSSRKSPPSWGPMQGSRENLGPEGTRGLQDLLHLQAQGLDLRDRGVLGPGNPRLRAPQWKRVDRMLGEDLQRE